jgi:hypothetical protein
MTYNAALTGGTLGKGLNFDGMTNLSYNIDLPRISEQNTQNLSIVALVKVKSFTGVTS